MRARPRTTRLRTRVSPTTCPMAVDEILAPASTNRHRAAVSLPDEFSKAIGFEVSRDMQAIWLSGGDHTHPATAAHRLHDVLIYDGTIFTRDDLSTLRSRRNRIPVPLGAIKGMQSGLLCTNYVAERYFGHFIVDALPLELLANELQRPPLALLRPPWLHEHDYRNMVGLHMDPLECVHVGTLWIVDDRHTNAGKVRRLKTLRERARSAVPKDGPRYVFIRRGRTGAKRHLVNEDEIVECLGKHGFAILDPEKEKAGAIARALANAEVLVGVEGSGMSHAHLVMPERSAMIAIQPPNRFSAFGKMFTDVLDQHYGFTVAHLAGDGFVQSADDLLRTIDLTQCEMAKAHS